MLDTGKLIQKVHIAALKIYPNQDLHTSHHCDERTDDQNYSHKPRSILRSTANRAQMQQKHVTFDLTGTKTVEPSIPTLNEDAWHPIKRILYRKRKPNGTLLYCVLWQNGEKSLLPARDITKDALNEFYTRLRQKRK